MEGGSFTIQVKSRHFADLQKEGEKQDGQVDRIGSGKHFGWGE